MRDGLRQASGATDIKRAWSSGIAALVLLALSMVPSLSGAQAIALVVDRAGPVVIDIPGGTSAVQLLMALQTGAKLHLSADSQLKLLYLQTGDEYTLTGPGDCVLQAAAPSFEASRMQRLSAKSTGPLKLRLDNVAFAGVVMRSGAFTSRYPAGIVTERPTLLVWSTLLDNARVRIDIRDEQGQLVWNADAVGTAIPVPDDISFNPGQRYEWTVRFADFEGPVSGSTFEFASTDIQALAAQLKPTDAATFSQRTGYALWLEQIGAIGEARRAWDLLAQERPSENVLATRARR